MIKYNQIEEYRYQALMAAYQQAGRTLQQSAPQTFLGLMVIWWFSWLYFHLEHFLKGQSPQWTEKSHSYFVDV